MYFSIVTGTTVGYGDITPSSTPARFFVVFHAVLIPVLFARYITRAQEKRDAKKIENTIKDRRQFLLKRLHSDIAVLLSRLEHQPKDLAELTFKTSESEYNLQTEYYYNKSKYDGIFKPKELTKDWVKEVMYSKLSKEYKKALEYALFKWKYIGWKVKSQMK